MKHQGKEHVENVKVNIFTFNFNITFQKCLIFNFPDDDWSSSDDDSLKDFFSFSQSKLKKKTCVTSSAPAVVSKENDDEFPWIIVFQWGGDTDSPFQLCNVREMGDVEEKILNGILSPKSRLKQRNIEAYPDFFVSFFGKIELCK